MVPVHTLALFSFRILPQPLQPPFILFGREKESKMAVAKRQGRGKPAKTEQRKVKERPRTGVRTSDRTALLPKPNLHRAGPGGRKNIYKKRSQRALSLSPMCAQVLSLSVSLSTAPQGSTAGREPRG